MATILDAVDVVRDEVDSVTTIVAPGMPVNMYLQVVQSAIGLLLSYRTQLEAAGMDFKVVDKLVEINNAARQLASDVLYSTSPEGVSVTKWNAAVNEAEELIYHIREAMTFGFRANPELLAKLALINDGQTIADFIQSLNDYATLGRANSELLTAIKYSMENIELAAELSLKLSTMYANVTLTRSASPELTRTRDKALTLLKQHAEEICGRARYLLCDDKEVATKFALRATRRKSPKKGDSKDPPVAK